MNNVGFIGLGNMGAGACNSLIRNGYKTTVFDINEKAMQQYEGKATLAKNYMDLFINSDYIFLSLPSSEIVEPILEDFLSHGVEGKTIIDVSTCFPLSTKTLYDKVKQNGGVYVDAPLSGTPANAQEGSLLVLFGGDKEQYDKLKPLMSCICNRYQYLGQSGSGHLAKVVMNFIALTYVVTYAQTFALTEKLGLDNNQLFELLQGSGMGCGVLNFYAGKMINKTYDMAFTLELAHKDLTYCKKLFEAYHVPGFALDGVLDLLRIGLKEGRGKHDYSECAAVMYEFFENK